MQSCDILIAGGGLAGLLLAAGLADARFAGLRVCVVEPRTQYVRDRTWSYWRQAPHRLSHLERRQWTQWSVAHAGHGLRHQAPGWVYASIDADALYQHALARLAQASHVRLMQGWRVHEMPPSSSGVVSVRNETEVEMISAQRVVDARARISVSADTLVQQFAGWEISAAQPVFDPGCVELMHFNTHERGLHFIYTLPYSPTQALVESTWISPASWQPDFEAEIGAVLAARLGADPLANSYREQGVLPLVQAASDERHLRIGRAAGTLRPATGYAFLETLQQVDDWLASCPQHAQRLQDWTPARFVRPRAQSWMDAVFLHELSGDWTAAPARFMSLFRHLEAACLVRFLSGQDSWADRVQVMRALPFVPYVKAAWQYSTQREPLWRLRHAR